MTSGKVFIAENDQPHVVIVQFKANRSLVWKQDLKRNYDFT